MAADNALNESVAAGKGLASKALGFAGRRLNPLKLSGIYATFGTGLLFVGGTWLFAPLAMKAAAVPVIQAGAGLGSNLASVASGSLSQFFTAVATTAKGAGSIAVNMDPVAMGEGIKTFFGGVNGTAVASGAPAGAPSTIGTALNAAFPNMSAIPAPV